MKTFINHDGPVHSKMNHPLNTRNYRYPTLTDEQRQGAEGKISLEEFTKVLNSLPSNKVPGNDGYQLSFTKCFGVPLETF